MADIETPTLLSLTVQNWAVTTSVSGVVIILLGAIYIWWRSGTFFFLRDRIWRFFDGKQSFDDPRFEKMRKRARELEFFRFEFNIPVRTFPDAELAEKWITRNQLPVDDVSLARPFIDWKDFSNIQLWPYKTIILAKKFWIIMIALVAIPFASGLALSLTPYLLMHFTGNGPNFYVKKSEIVLGIRGRTLTIQDCSTKESLSPFVDEHFSNTQVEVLCQILLPPHNNETERKISSQRAVGLALAVEFFIIAIFIIRQLSKSTAALRIETIIRTKDHCLSCTIRQRKIPEHQAKKLINLSIKY